MGEHIKPSKTHIPDLLENIATSGFRIDVAPKTFTDWGTVARACGIADDQIDNTLDFEKRRAIMQDGVSYIQGTKDALGSSHPNYIEQMAKLRELVSQLPTQQQENFVRHLRVFCRVTEKIRQETNVQEASKLRRIEGQIYSRLYMDVSPEEIRSSPQFPEFGKAFAKVCRVGNNIDGFMDLSDDFLHERTLVQPTFLNRVVFLKDTVSDLTKTLGIINGSFVVKAAAIIRREYFNRRTFIHKV